MLTIFLIKNNKNQLKLKYFCKNVVLIKAKGKNFEQKKIPI